MVHVLQNKDTYISGALFPKSFFCVPENSKDNSPNLVDTLGIQKLRLLANLVFKFSAVH